MCAGMNPSTIASTTPTANRARGDAASCTCVASRVRGVGAGARRGVGASTGDVGGFDAPGADVEACGCIDDGALDECSDPGCTGVGAPGECSDPPCIEPTCIDDCAPTELSEPACADG